MANCTGCAFLQQDGGHQICSARNNEVIDQAEYSAETCERFQAQAPAKEEARPEEEPPEERKSEKKKPAASGDTGTGCLVALLVFSIILFLCVLGLIGVTVFLGGRISV